MLNPYVSLLNPNLTDVSCFESSFTSNFPTKSCFQIIFNHVKSQFPIIFHQICQLSPIFSHVPCHFSTFSSHFHSPVPRFSARPIPGAHLHGRVEGAGAAVVLRRLAVFALEGQDLAMKKNGWDTIIYC